MLIRSELKDPRIPMMLTLTSVELTRDLSIARIYYALMNADDAAEVQKALTGGAGFLRRRLGNLLKLRTIPELRFHPDRSAEEGARMSALIDRAVKSNTTEADTLDESAGDN